mmetsp:Transcript_50555/g.121770  ORF Transcript_50555/g.121770 Transcript_50555/m.121770 type:complete len:141 (-) Transcript_50555:155-577(-)
MLSEALEAMGMEVVEELCTGPKVYNDSVRIVSADFEELYTVSNIRKLGKQGAAPDAHRAKIVDAVRPVYEEWFGLAPVPKQMSEADKMVENDFGFGNAGDEGMFGSGLDMFGNPIKTSEKSAPPPEPASMSFTFSMDEDF